MATKIFKLERNGKLEEGTFANPNDACCEWAKDPEHCKVAELNVVGDILRYLPPDECSRIAGSLMAHN
jgi:hypothetical protein